MVANTLKMDQPVLTASVADPRSDMFAQSSALYSRINKKTKTSPWMIIAPAAVIVLVGGALVATSTPHNAPTRTGPAPVQSAPAASPSQEAPVTRTVTTHTTTAPTAVKVHTVHSSVPQSASRVPTTARQASDADQAPSAYDHPAATPTIVTPAPAINIQPAPATPTAPAPTAAAPNSPAPAIAAPSSPAPDAAASATPATPPSQ